MVFKIRRVIAITSDFSYSHCVVYVPEEWHDRTATKKKEVKIKFERSNDILADQFGIERKKIRSNNA